MEGNFISLIQKLNSIPKFSEPATESIKVNLTCKGLLLSQISKLISHGIKIPVGQLIHADAEYVLSTNSTHLSIKSSEIEVWKQKCEQVERKVRELSNRLSDAAVTITKLQQQVRTLEGSYN